MSRPDSSEPLESVACTCGATAVLAEALTARDEVHGGLFTYMSCTACGVQRVDPRPTRGRIGHYYPESYASHRVSTSPGLGERVRRLVYRLFHAPQSDPDALRGPLAVVLRLVLMPMRFRSHVCFPAPTRRRVFEFGAGAGAAAAEFKACGWEVHGCDPSPVACEGARHRGIELQQCSAEDALVEEGAYGCVFINNVLEHVHDPMSVLSKARRGLADDGVLEIVVPNHDSMGARWFGAAWPGYDPPRHLWGFAPDNLRALLAQSGFVVERIVHMAPQLWSWRDCISGARLPHGGSAMRTMLARFVPWLLMPVGLVLAASDRGEFMKVLARKAVRPAGG